jgi:NAD(P)-dependent dehydrogenase (short-subunit alcohol dehydrogenase family)
MEKRESVVLVTGASSGIGNACATFLAKRGDRVYGSCRSPSSYQKKADEFFEMLALELTDQGSIDKAAQRILSAEGRIDILVCCAGFGMLGAVENVPVSDCRELMDADFFGTLRTILAFLPSMRAAGCGKIIVVGALEASVPGPYQAAFSATARALEGLVESLRMETLRFGVEIGILEVGSFHGGFGKARRTIAPPAEADPYRRGFDNAMGVLSRDEALGPDPLLAARKVIAMLAARRMPPKRLAGRLAKRLLAHSRAWLGPRAFEFLVRKYYRID